MAWYDARLWMCTPGCKAVLEPIPQQKAQLLSYQPVEGVQQPVIDPAVLAQWLIERGFQVDRAGPHWLKRDALEVSPGEENGSVDSIRLTFTIFNPFRKKVLVHDYKDRWRQWVVQLSDVWGFQLLDPESCEPVAAAALFDLLRKTPACEGFAI